MNTVNIILEVLPFWQENVALYAVILTKEIIMTKVILELISFRRRYPTMFTANTNNLKPFPD